MFTSDFKGRPAVVVEGTSLTAVFLPEDGAKLSSLCVRGRGKELLAVKKGETYKVLRYEGDYVSSECSGFDDMFPTVDPYTPIEGRYKGITYPDHGESCRLPYTYESYKEGVIFHAKSRIFPIKYEKTILPAQDGGIDIAYRICNQEEVAFPFLWAGHIMLQGEDGMKVFTPFGCNAATEMMFATKGVPEKELPMDHLSGYQAGTGPAYKFYYLEPMNEGRFGVSYADGDKLTFEVDPEKLPYLGLWFNNGEFQDLYTITPEPCTVPFDAPDRAKSRGYVSTISAKSEFSFKIHIFWEEKNR